MIKINKQLTLLSSFVLALFFTSCDGLYSDGYYLDEEKQVFHFDRLYNLIIESDDNPAYLIRPKSSVRIMELSLDNIPSDCEVLKLSDLDNAPMHISSIKLLPNATYEIGNCKSRNPWQLILYETDNQGRLHCLSSKVTRCSGDGWH